MFKKLALSLVCIGAMSTSIQAEDSTFVGISGVFTDSGMTLEEYSEQISLGTDDKMAGGAVRFGAVNDSFRTIFAIGYDTSYDTTHELDYSTIYGELMLDYLVFSSSDSLKDSMFQPYVGINVGYAFFNSDTGFTENGVDYSLNIDDNGFTYGMQGGFIFELGESVNLDIGAKYTFKSIDYLEDSASGYIALDYKF